MSNDHEQRPRVRLCRLLGRSHGSGQRRKQNDKLVAREPSHGCRIGDHFAHSSGDLHQQFITRLMAKCVVDDFEVIDINEETGAIPRGSLHRGQGFLHSCQQ